MGSLGLRQNPDEDSLNDKWGPKPQSRVRISPTPPEFPSTMAANFYARRVLGYAHNEVMHTLNVPAVIRSWPLSN